MKKTNLIAATLSLLIITSVLSAFTFSPSGKSTCQRKLCGPALRFTNPAGATVTQVKIQRIGGPTTTINNPSFPFTHNGDSAGNYTIVFYMSGSASGAITVKDSGFDEVECEDFQAPYLSPFTFYADCETYYVIITSGSCS